MCMITFGNLDRIILTYGNPHLRGEVSDVLYRFDLLVTAIKANQSCKQERQNFSVLRSTPIARHIEPEIAKEAAISLIDCFHRLYLMPCSASSTLSKQNVAKFPSSVFRKAAIVGKKLQTI